MKTKLNTFKLSWNILLYIYIERDCTDSAEIRTMAIVKTVYYTTNIALWNCTIISYQLTILSTQNVQVIYIPAVSISSTASVCNRLNRWLIGPTEGVTCVYTCEIAGQLSTSSPLTIHKLAIGIYVTVCNNGTGQNNC